MTKRRGFGGGRRGCASSYCETSRVERVKSPRERKQKGVGAALPERVKRGRRQFYVVLYSIYVYGIFRFSTRLHSRWYHSRSLYSSVHRAKAGRREEREREREKIEATKDRRGLLGLQDCGSYG